MKIKGIKKNRDKEISLRKEQMKIYNTLFTLILIFGLISPVNALESDLLSSENTYFEERLVYTYGMTYNYPTLNANSFIQPFSTFYGDCGSVVLTASGGILTVVIRPNFVVWNFTGAVTDSLTGAWFMSAHSLDNSETFNLTRKSKIHSITLTGTAKDITGVSCSVVPNATISHFY